MRKTIFALLFALSFSLAWADAPQALIPKMKRQVVNGDSIAAKKVCGIDVSAHQGQINWKEVAKTKIAFVFVKATEGADHTDALYKDNIKGAREAGLTVGAFHFFRTTSSVQDQFNNFITTVGKDDLDLIPVIDIEENKNWSKEQLCDSLRGFVDLVDKHFGCKPIIYTGERFYINILGPDFDDCMLNVAKYSLNEPRINRQWQLWQFTESGRVTGIKGHVDLNILGDKVKLEELLLPDKKNNKSRR